MQFSFMLCAQVYCVLCVFGLLSAEFSTVNTVLGGLILWKPLSVEYS